MTKYEKKTPLLIAAFFMVSAVFTLTITKNAFAGSLSDAFGGISILPKNVVGYLHKDSQDNGGRFKRNSGIFGGLGSNFFPNTPREEGEVPMDIDADEQVSSSEYTASLIAQFRRIDRDKDLLISKNELASSIRFYSERRILERFSFLDRDIGGELTRNESYNIFRSLILTNADVDQNGSISPREFVLTVASNIAEFEVIDYDQDYDDQVGLEEYIEVSTRTAFDPRDPDGDRLIPASDFN